MRRDNIRAGLLRRVGASFVAVAVAGLATFAAPAIPMQIGRPVPVASGEVRVAVNGETVVELPLAASHVALHWPGNEEAALTVAFSRDGRTFGSETGVEHDEVGDRAASSETYGGVMFADGARFARVTSDRPLADVTVVALDSQEAVGIASWPSSMAIAATGQPPIIPRAAWGADESYRFTSQGLEAWPRVFEPVQKIVIHHSAGPNYDPNPAATVRSIMYLDAITKGWSDMGYNFLIDNVGNIYEGRYSRAYAPSETPTGEDEAGRLVTGAHALYFNSGVIGIVMMGNFVDQDITPAARASLESLVAWLAERHGLDPLGAGTYVNPVTGVSRELPNILGHRNVSATACPGGVFYDTLPAVRQAVAARIASTTGAGFDTTVPLVVALSPASPTPTNGHSASFGIVFSEPVTDLTLDDFSLTGTSTGWTLTGLTGSASVWRVTMQADAPIDGSLQVTLAAGGIADLAGLVGPAAPVASTPIDWTANLSGTVSRIAGADRYETAAAISAATFPPGGVPVAYVATGASAADSLAGSVAAALGPGPLLLIPGGSVPPAVAAELTRLSPERIVILGGPGVVPDSVVPVLDALTPGLVYRIGGADRYATAAAISAQTFAPGVPVAYVATGRTYADALAGSVAAALGPGPMLLVPGGSVPATVANELYRLQPGRIVILGGTGVVPDAIVPTLDALTPGLVYRIAGADRYQTAAAISAATFAPDVPVAYVATGASYADALAGSVAAALGHGPLLLLPGASIPPAVAAELTRLSPARIVILGGTGVMSAGLADQLAAYVAP